MNLNRGLLAGVSSAFLIGTIFWAGATYNRIEGIEARLVGIEQSLVKMSNLTALEVRIQENQRRLDRLEEIHKPGR